MNGKVLTVTCVGTSRTLNTGDSITVQAQINNSGSVTWTMYITLEYRDSTGVLLRVSTGSESVAPGVTINFNDIFNIPSEFEGENISVWCVVRKDSHMGEQVTIGGCENLFYVQAPTVSAEVVRISVI